MDQNSTNGTSSDKRNWRERLGIGARDMPKLSDEFKEQPAAAQATVRPAATARPAVKAPQPVTRPAPMAPRVPPAKPSATQIPNGQPRQAAPAAPPANDALAERLRAQRAAAEKLAEQRVLAARERAEGKAATTPVAASGRPRTVEPSLPSGSGPRPKFTFADEEAAPQVGQRPGSGPLLPPRPALGGDRTQPPFLRPSGAAQPPFRAESSPPPYRPIDPATGYPAHPSRQPTPPLRPYGNDAGGYPARVPPRRPAYDPYVRGPEPAFDGDGYPDEPPPRLGRPTPGRGRGRGHEADHEDVFEDEPAPRRRASARDYQSAYRETEEGYEDDRRRSGGPWLLLLALLVAALVTGGIVWYYNTKIKTVSAPAAQGEQVPVIQAPEQAAKSVPEAPASALGGESPAMKKKQIYDRIVGEQEVNEGQVVPTEEVPVQPEPAAAEDSGVGQIPDPIGAAAPEALEEPAPLPLPPPPSGETQGSLDQSGAAKIAAAAAEEPPALPPPDPEAEPAAVTEQAPPPAKEPASTETPMTSATKQKTKTAAAASKKKAAAAATEDLGAEPVVLVPPSQAEDVSPITGESLSAPAASPSQQQAQAPAQQGAAPAKKKTIFDLFRKSDEPETPVAQPAQQVASIEQPAEPAPAPQTSATQQAKPATPAGSGYMIQLASFRTQTEAQNEYGRLRSKYPSIIGRLPSSISQATVAGSTRYRVGVGPVASREEASKVCNSLFSAGERDCLVRSQ